ncbi:MAG: hypothetical protein ACSW8A_02115 [Lachnospiraceae bacterium]
MNINDYSYLWTSEKEDWVLVNTEFGYGIVNIKSQMALMISDEELENAIIEKMKSSGNRIYNDINEAYLDA